MSNEIKAIFAIELCDSCKKDKIIGDKCLGCKLNKVIKAKVDLNIELCNHIDKLEEVINKIHDEISWCRITYKDKLKFGLPEDQAIKARERRYNGVFMTILDDIKPFIKDEENEQHED